MIPDLKNLFQKLFCCGNLPHPSKWEWYFTSTVVESLLIIHKRESPPFLKIINNTSIPNIFGEKYIGKVDLKMEMSHTSASLNKALVMVILDF